MNTSITMPLMPGRDDEIVRGMLQVVEQVAVEHGLALLGEPHAHVHLGARLPRHQLAQERHVRRRHLHVDEEVGAREREQDDQLVGVEQQRVEVELAALVLQDRHRERHLFAAVDDLAHRVGAPCCGKRATPAPGSAGWAARARVAGSARAARAARCAGRGAGPPRDWRGRSRARWPQRPAQALSQRVVAAVRRLVALQVLGGHRRAPEDELVAVVAPVQHRAGDRVVEGLGALGLPVLVQQRYVGELDRRPQRLVALGLGKARPHLVHCLQHALVVHLDALAREDSQRGPVGALEERLRARRGLAEQAVVPVEAGEDRARDLRGALVARLVDRDDLRRRRHHQAAFFAASFDCVSASSPKNCSSSVEPCSAVVEALPAVTTCVTWSK